MKILVIGGTGHVASHLVPMLVSQGHKVFIGTRGNTPAKITIPDGVQFVTCDSSDPEKLKALANETAFDAVVDFPGTGYHTWQAFRDKASHVVVCGSLWMFGQPNVVPTPEIPQNLCPFESYALRFQQIQQMVKESPNYKAAFTAIMPPNICGPGKIPLDTSGGRSIEVHKANMRGETVYLPDGPQALIAPCDAYDLASLFALALNNPDKADGQIFNGGPEYALSITQFVKTYANIYRTEIPISYVSWEDYKKIIPSMGAWWHFYADMCPDISKAKLLLGYKPCYTSEEAMERAVIWMKEKGLLSL